MPLSESIYRWQSTVITYRNPNVSKRYRPRLWLLIPLGNNSPRLPVKTNRASGCQIFRSQPLQKWYTHAVRQCVCDFSEFSKRIPRPEYLRVVCILSNMPRRHDLYQVSERGEYPRTMIFYRAHTWHISSASPWLKIVFLLSWVSLTCYEAKPRESQWNISFATSSWELQTNQFILWSARYWPWSPITVSHKHLTVHTAD